MIIDNEEYRARVVSIAKRSRDSTQRVLRCKRDLDDAIKEDSRISADVDKLATDYNIELFAAAHEADEYDADARELVWRDVDAEAEKLAR